MAEVITRDGLATHPGDGVSKHLLASLPYVHAALEAHMETGVPTICMSGGRS
jgi:hypothetical protein